MLPSAGVMAWMESRKLPQAAPQPVAPVAVAPTGAPAKSGLQTVLDEKQLP